VTIEILNEKQVPIRTVTQKCQRGYGQFLWDGYDDEKRAAPGGVYSIGVFTDRTHPNARRPDSAKRQLPVSDVRLDQSTGTVTYNLVEPASVQVRLGIGGGGPLLRTIEAIQGTGTQVLRWDGWDQSRAINFLDHGRVVASVLALSLPENSVIVQDTTMAPRSASVPLRIRISEPSPKSTPKERDRLRAEVSLGDNPATYLGADRYEWVFFIDHRFVFEEEAVKSDPYRFELDVSGLAEGEHVLTVNLVGREDYSAVSFSERFERRIH
jgi:hypothetical protein